MQSFPDAFVLIQGRRIKRPQIRSMMIIGRKVLSYLGALIHREGTLDTGEDECREAGALYSIHTCSSDVR